MDLAANDSNHIDLDFIVFQMDIGYLTRLITNKRNNNVDYGLVGMSRGQEFRLCFSYPHSQLIGIYNS